MYNILLYILIKVYYYSLNFNNTKLLIYLIKTIFITFIVLLIKAKKRIGY